MVLWPFENFIMSSQSDILDIGPKSNWVLWNFFSFWVANIPA